MFRLQLTGIHLGLMIVRLEARIELVWIQEPKLLRVSYVRMTDGLQKMYLCQDSLANQRPFLSEARECSVFDLDQAY